MAAHVYTALDGILGNLMQGKWPEWEQLDAALNLSCWTEDLELEEWRALKLIVDHHKDDYSASILLLKAYISYLHQNYYIVHAQLGYPRTREEWNRKRFNL